MDNRFKARLGLTIGDTNGIGPEVIIKTLSDQRILNFCTPVIYASANVLNRVRKALSAEHFNYQQVQSIQAIVPKKVNLITCLDENLEVHLGNPTPESGKASLDSLMAASRDLKAGLLDGIVTAPIDKENIQTEEFKFPGHTEFLTSYFDAPESLMLLVSGDLRVATITGHMPVKDVSARISFDLIIRKVTILLESLKKDFGILKPRIAILGLNPHAGENGLLGTEELEIIRPAIMHLKEKGHLVFGPYPADGFFGMQQYKQVDAVVSMYHDQGLIPFKTLAFESGVNFTAGLPIVRTSPDHGTAYDIASKHTASETSFREALFLACDIIKKRTAEQMPVV
ncbi:4-hydroxythreonine-4-phosphate dehydrogenase PdxA [Pontibacter sp. BT310]|uniref:4-hydroxythreonine-4-phosphate dehydrogenase PdxA n=1 Tax=Pontibacter populi TaxID=890055 RepID=A0ABS6XBH3_9BACT|nr:MULTISPECIES: 4-hydroxythreonine-4-phosphate dehydrogenase PdxA [Pontibacter]MBJ6118494.1 4-hydroxythreonine-4-phosphate dehydrogenase PdxA [Pontibacter sp. BT310]MBR0570923.1 4-hydroxythreonine-4-phosphate dehydrogenase PdxA [Microvirga sp. STS03]MBW3365348.1 4-hydroxythreonine-4-phosphate dehydrogenase PdxA [Pontibacter populi]